MITYLTIMRNVLKAIIKGGSTPSLSRKDWECIIEALSTLDKISKAMNTVNAEYFKDCCVTYFETLEDVTGHDIISKEEDKE